MNVTTGSVSTLRGWADDFENMTEDEWGGARFSDCFGPNGLIEVMRDADGSWIEAE